MQIKGTQRDHFSSIRLAKIQSLITLRAVKSAGKEALLHPLGGSGNWHSPLEGNLTLSIKVINAYTL